MPAERKANIWFPTAPDTTGALATAAVHIFPPLIPRQHEAQNFACQLARELEQGRISNSYQRLILVVSAPFIGLVNSNMGRHVRSMVSDTFEKDYTKTSEKNLTQTPGKLHLSLNPILTESGRPAANRGINRSTAGLFRFNQHPFSYPPGYRLRQFRHGLARSIPHQCYVRRIGSLLQ